MSDFALRLGLALVVVTVACAAIIISRRNYARSADSERNLGAFRLEFQRSIDAAQAATIKTIRENIFSVIKTINSTVKDFSVRLARLEERADETATHFAGAQNLEVHLARLEPTSRCDCDLYREFGRPSCEIGRTRRGDRGADCRNRGFGCPPRATSTSTQ